MGLLAPAIPSARAARVEGRWVYDGRGQPVLARLPLGEGVCSGVLVEVPDNLSPALGMAFAGAGIEQVPLVAVVALAREPAQAWALPSLRMARMHGYRGAR